VKNILINAYACAPHKGSEPGMGWNWITSIAQFCKVHVITEGEWQAELEAAIKILPQGYNITFYYLPVSDKIRNMCWNQGDWRFYYYYRKWQKRALKKAQHICKTRSIDIIHQLNMVGYREPGMLWKIKNIPLVWGPIGGFGGIPNNYLKTFAKKEAIKQKIKQLLNAIQVYFPYIQKAIKNSNILIACNSDAHQQLSRFRKDPIYTISEVGTFYQPIKKEQAQKWDSPTLHLAWIGKLDSRKALPLALEVYNKLKLLNIKLHVIGVDKSDIHQLAIKPSDNIIFYPWLPLNEVHQKLQACHLLFFSSLYEATGTVVLEALTYGIPVLCHDTCGQGDIIDNTCGIKVAMKNIDNSIDAFSSAIEYLYNNREELKKLSDGAYKKAESLTWEKKGKLMEKIYAQILTK
jgi:glycosyltransferase involved in cell wall biosynthesis